jgi:hypothetical protein
MKSKFAISNVLSVSWKALVSQIWILAGLLIGYVLLSFIVAVLSPDPSSIIVQLIITAIGLIFNLGYLKNLFQTLDGDEPRFSAYGQQARKIGVYFVSYVLYTVLVLIVIAVLMVPFFYVLSQSSFIAIGAHNLPVIPEGSGMSLLLTILAACVLLLPAIYIAIRLMFFQAFIVEEDAGIIDSLKKSWKITKGQEVSLFLFGLVSLGLTIVGCLLFLIGLFVAIPLIYMMYCCTFRKLNT